MRRESRHVAAWWLVEPFPVPVGETPLGGGESAAGDVGAGQDGFEGFGLPGFGIGELLPGARNRLPRIGLSLFFED